jgi:Cleft lip and palate transmembrane protein 1 (CLPTM1)
MWKPAVPIEMVADMSVVKLGAMPANVASEYRVNAAETRYFPPFFVNEFWILRDQLRRMNETVAEATLELSFRTVSLTRWSIARSIEGMWETQQRMGTLRESEPDDLKRMFLETNPVLLGTTMLVSLAHSVLEALAFRSDITHWKSIKNMEGVSVRSMMWSIVMQMIVFLYLFDNETSWMITIGNGIGIAIEVWKLRKAVKIKSFGTRKLLGFIPWFELQHDDTYSSKTKEFDDEAMRYLSYVVYPCVIGYAAYSLKYERHKSWYSWVIGSLVGAVYTFGFLMMLPQVLINYRLKSVAHMPMKSFAFKFLNTIIDDMFSFIIKMPWLHRLACFRDDVVFVVYLYQMWIYPVDQTRVNEFGQRGDKGDPTPEAAAATAPEVPEARKTAVEKKTN